MKKDNRKQYLQGWLDYLKGKKEIDYQELVKWQKKKFKTSYSSITLKRYGSTLISNLFENGYVSGEWGRGVKAGPLTIVKQISMPVLDKCLSQNSMKVHFAEEDLTQAKQQIAPPARVRKVPKKTPKAPQKKSQARSRRAKPPKEKKAIAAARRLPRKDLSRTEQNAFYTAQQLLEQVSLMEKQLATYERVFQSLKTMFGQEIFDIEKQIERFLK
jgi:hypothetical protein